MPEVNQNASKVILSYRRRKERMTPLLLGGLAVLLLVVGVVFVVLWVTGENPPQISFLSSATPTATETGTPTATATETGTPTETPPPSETATPEGPQTYIVAEGDSLFSIAEQFGIELELLVAANPEAASGVLLVGQTLIIPAPDSEFPTATPLALTLIPGTTVEYTVRPGDSLQSIAALFNSTADAIAEENEIDDPNTIQVGQVLLVPVGIATPTLTPSPDPNTATPSPLP
jgi:LysM repeat protein